MSTRWVARIGCALALVAGGRLGGGEVRVAASDLLDAEFAAAAQDFARESELKLTLVLDGSRDAEARLRDDRADIGLIMLRLGQPAPGDGFRSFPLGYQVVCVLVAAASPLTQVTVPDVAGIYGAAAGASHVRWGELGLTGDWAVRTIEPLALAVGAGLSHELFRELVLAGGDFKSVVALQPSVDELTRKLAASQAGIALAGALAPDQARGLKLLPLARTANEIAYAPTPEHVHAGNYPLRLPLWLVVRRAAAAADLEFLQFLVGDDVARALERAGFVPLPRQARDELRFEFERL